MSQENIEIVRRIYTAWAGDHVPGPVELLDPDIEYVNPEGAIEPGVRRGLEAFTAATERTLEGWSSWEMEPEQFKAMDDRFNRLELQLSKVVDTLSRIMWLVISGIIMAFVAFMVSGGLHI